MAKILLSYDIKLTSRTIHTELKNCLIDQYGYSETIKASSGRIYELPNTTLRKDGISKETASKEFLQACRDVNAHWEKYIVAEYTSSSFNNQE